MSERTVNLREWLNRSPLVAILRGVRPTEAVAVASAVAEAGIRIIEVPMNSPQPLKSIEAIAADAGDAALVGVGTLTVPAGAAPVAAAGGRLAVMPHADVEVIRAARSSGLAVMAGVLTPSEALAALDAGADALKLFPAQMAPPGVLNAIRTVLPSDVLMLPVGGIAPESMADYWHCGAAGFGLGSALYRPGMPAAEVGRRAREFVDRLEAARHAGTPS